MRYRPLPYATAGFSLTEMAIVLGIVGLVLSAIWGVASEVQQKNRLELALRDNTLIADNYRGYFSLHGVDVTDGTDITCNGVTNNYFPADMVRGACTAGTTSTYPMHPWNGYVSVVANQTLQGIVLRFAALSRDNCIQYGSYVANAPDMLKQTVNTTSVTLPPAGTGTPMTIAQVTAACANNNSNFVELTFKAR